MADPHNVEFEAAKFLQKLIHESTDEPAKLATKLYVILQHMKASGKENSMPYQVISRAMETVINQHGLDIEALMSSRLPLSSGSHGGESARAQSAGCSQSQPAGGAIDSKSGLVENDTTRSDGFGSGKPPAAPSSAGSGPFQGSVSQDRRDPPGWEQQGSKKDTKRANIKRKRADTSGMETQDDISQQLDSHSGIPDARREMFNIKLEAGVDPECWKQGLFKGTTSSRERPGPPSSGIQVDSSRNLTSASSVDAAGISHIPANAERLSQSANPSNLFEEGIPTSSASRDTGKYHAIPASGSSMPFKEHHLKQLRAQCLVFLAFRNGLSPKKLHLDIALGNMLPREGTSSYAEGAQNELVQDKGKQQTTLASSSVSEVPLLHGNMATAKTDGAPTVSSTAFNTREGDMVSKGPDNVNPVVGHMGSSADRSHADEEKKHHLVGGGIQEADKGNSETASLQADAIGMRNAATHIHEENWQSGGANHDAALMSSNKQLKSEMSRWSRVNHNELSRGTLPASFQHDLGSNNESSSLLSQCDSNIQNQQRADGQMSNSWKSIQSTDSGHHRARPMNDANMLPRNALLDGNGAIENQTRSVSDGSKVPVSDSNYMFKDSSSLAPMDRLSPDEANLRPSAKYTLSEKWIMAHQKKKIATEQKWVQKLQKADQRISTCFSELKETVSSSADISAKTRSVIELKKLQLLELQRCLRRNIMSDFFKPIQTEMDRLKSIKKHRIGRRLKHVEKYEQKMKEERQKRIRERQKEFFSEVEVHKERLEDVFKYKRERCKSFNRYVKEYHKRKERIHREKIDRIQREKINLLKINDVEGYLRMVQDAKSDRVNKLLKETEKYLQKLGSKLKEAKAAARQVEMDDRAVIEDSIDIFTETEDENDQAKHYKESNEKYYLIAHSIKENIAEQPTGLRGGKLREYQMNGLRWLVSLYNNHLNGILADEMGLGKTVQVISLICYLMETKNDRGPFLVVVPSSVLPGWEHELNFWAPGINKIVYTGPPEERRRLFKESIVHQKFNVLLTTYEYLMNKHDRPKLSKIYWHYIIIDEGHRIKNASCKLNADLKYYNSSHRLLLTGTPLQNNLEELWALLNFLLPNIFNSSEDFSQWFNKPFESNGDNSLDETLLSEEENLLIINRLHQVLRPFVLRRLKHKVENELPEKIERLIRCEASAYQKLLMKRVEENLGSLGVSKARAVHNSVMELRNICNHPYLSQLHADEVDSYIPKHFLPPIVRLCGKLEMLDRLLPKLKETNHRVLFFSTMTRLLDVMEEYLVWKKYRYLRLDGHTSGLDRGALIDKFNQPDSPFFIFLLSIRAGGVGVNLQAADTVIIFDTDWNPQVDLQAQARAHRIGQKKDVLVLRLETVNTVEEQVRASAEHKLGVANQSITAGFFDNNTSAEDRREYLESLLRESKKEEAAPVLDDDSLNDILARSESEIDVFEAVDQRRREEEMVTWKRLVSEKEGDCSDAVPPLPARLVTDDDLTAFYEAMKVYDIPNAEAASSSGMKRKSGSLGGFDTQQYGRGKRAREVRSYEEQWTEDEFEKMCQAESPETPKPKDEKISLAAESSQTDVIVKPLLHTPQAPPPSSDVSPMVKKEVTPPVKRGRGRPRRLPAEVSPVTAVSSTPIGVSKSVSQLQKGEDPSRVSLSGSDTIGTRVVTENASGDNPQVIALTSQSSPTAVPLPSVDPGAQCDSSNNSVSTQSKKQGRKGQSMEKNIDGNSGTEPVRRRGRKPGRVLSPVPSSSRVRDSKVSEVPREQLSSEAVVPTTRMASLSYPSADSLGTTRPNCLEGHSRTDIEEIKESTLVAKETSNDVLDQELTAVQDPKLDVQSTKPAILNSSSVALDLPEASSMSKDVPVSQDQDASISASTVGPIVGALPSPKSGTELPKVALPAANPSSELAVPSPVGLRPGTRQSQKPQSGIEPVRRRGRKRGRIASTDPASPQFQDKTINDPGKIMFSPSISAVTNVATPSVPNSVGIDPRLATVPVIPLVPVSGYMIGATPLASNSVSNVSKGLGPSMPTSSQQSLLSGTPDMSPGIQKLPVSLPFQGQDQKVQAEETAPRRRGRKKIAATSGNNSAGDFVERKVITTRSRQINISQAEASTYDTSITLNNKNIVAMQSSKPPSQVVSPSNLDFFVEADGASKHRKSRPGNPREDTAVCHIPAETPPVSCKGKTNVIVLALELTTLDVDPKGTSSSNADGKEENSSMRMDSARDVLAPAAPGVQVSGLDVSLPAEIQASTHDDELSAPPGFDTPRSGLSESAVKKSFKTDGCSTPNISDAKRASVVLALESTAQTVDPCTVSCEKMLDEQECSTSLTFKDSILTSIPPSEPIGCAPGSEFVDTMTSQSEEEMSAPPGFDIPQRRISEKALATSLGVVHGLASDIETGNASKSQAENFTLGASNIVNHAVPRASNAVGFDVASASILELSPTKDEQSRGLDVDNVKAADSSNTSHVGDSVVESSSLETKVEICHGTNNGYAEKDIHGSDSNASAASRLDSKGSGKDTGALDTDECGDDPTASFTPIISTCVSREMKECQDIVAKGVSTMEASREERRESDNVNDENCGGNVVIDAVASSSLESEDRKKFDELDNDNAGSSDGNVISDTMPSSLKFKEKEECQVPGYANAGNADNVSSLTSDLKQKEGCHEPSNVNAGDNTDNISSNIVASTSSEVKENEECHDPDNVNTGIEADNVVSDVVASSLEFQEKEVCQVPDNVGVGNDAANVVSDVAASPVLGLQEKGECQVPVDGKDEHDGSNTLPDSLAASSETAATSPLESKERKEFHGYGATTEHAAADAAINIRDSEMVSASSSELIREGDGHDKENNKHCGDDVKKSDTDTSILPSKDEQEPPRINDGNVEQDGENAPATSHVATDNQAASALDKE